MNTTGQKAIDSSTSVTDTPSKTLATGGRVSPLELQKLIRNLPVTLAPKKILLDSAHAEFILIYKHEAWIYNSRCGDCRPRGACGANWPCRLFAMLDAVN